MIFIVADQCGTHSVVHELVQRHRQPDDTHQYERSHTGHKIAQGNSGRGKTADRIRISTSNHIVWLVY